MLEISCQNCQNYTEPAHNGNLVCAVNPDCVDDAEKCRHYESISLPVVEPNVIQQAIALRWQTRFQAWRERTQTDAESLKVEILIDEPPAPTEWVVPKALEQHIQRILPEVLFRLQKYYPQYATLTAQQVAVALINYTEQQMFTWCISNPKKLIEADHLIVTLRDDLNRISGKASDSDEDYMF
jgi:hypothetical protein